MPFASDISPWGRPARALGRLSLMLLIGGIFGCDRSRQDPSDRLNGRTKPAPNEYNEAEAVRRMQESLRVLAEEQARLDAEIRELNRVRDLPPFENALEPKGWRRISRAFLLEKDRSGKLSITEQLVGRLPSDPERYVPQDHPAGVYLVGSMMPSGGYAIDDDRGEERFCLSVSEDGEHLEGEGVSARLPMHDVRQRLHARAAD